MLDSENLVDGSLDFEILLERLILYCPRFVTIRDRIAMHPETWRKGLEQFNERNRSHAYLQNLEKLTDLEETWHDDSHRLTILVVKQVLSAITSLPESKTDSLDLIAERATNISKVLWPIYYVTSLFPKYHQWDFHKELIATRIAYLDHDAVTKQVHETVSNLVKEVMRLGVPEDKREHSVDTQITSTLFSTNTTLCEAASGYFISSLDLSS